MKLLADRSRRVRRVKLETESGMVPEKLLCEKSSVWRYGRLKETEESEPE